MYVGALSRLTHLGVVLFAGTALGCTTFSSLDPPDKDGGGHDGGHALDAMHGEGGHGGDGGHGEGGHGGDGGHGEGGHGGDGGHGGHGDGGHMGSGFELADSCFDELQVLDLSHHNMGMISSEGLTDTVSDFSMSACSRSIVNGNATRGRDGFVAADLAAGERVHFMAVPGSDEQDVAVYFLSEACDAGACVKLLDKCGAGAAEHSNLIIPQGGRYILGVEVNGPPAEPFRMMVAMPRCGDEMRVHGENCDDGNLVSADGCDPLCRTELLADNALEVERNDDVLEANVIVFPTGTGVRRVRGQLGGLCDRDRFAVRVPDGASIRATVLDATGAPCGSAPDVEMRLVEGSETGSTLGMGSSGGTGAECPSIEETASFAQDLPQAEYHIMLQAPAGVDVFEYSLEIELAETPAT